MSHIINVLLSTELTCIPRLIDNYFGKYYSNTVGNAIAWVTLMWLIVHFVFDAYLSMFLKQLHYKEYVCSRISQALWYCGFYGINVLFCLGTIYQNGPSQLFDWGNVSIHTSMGLGLFGSFFFQSLIWSLLKNGLRMEAFTFATLAMLPVTTYFSRRTDSIVFLMVMICLVQFSFNLLRCCKCTVDKTKINLKGFFIFCLGLFIFVHLLIIPIFIIGPLLLSLRKEFYSPDAFLATNLICWWTFTLYSEPLYMYFEHRSKIKNNAALRDCSNNAIECSLFQHRDDYQYEMLIIKKEIKEREAKQISRRVTKGRGTLVQTIKCMVAIKRKLNKKRNAACSDTESEMLNDDENNVKQCDSFPVSNTATAMDDEYLSENPTMKQDVSNRTNCNEEVMTTESNENSTNKTNFNTIDNDKKNV